MCDKIGYLLVSVFKMFLGVWDDTAYGGNGPFGCKIKPTEVNIGFRPCFKTGFNPYTTKYINNKKTWRDIVFERVQLISL